MWVENGNTVASRSGLPSRRRLVATAPKARATDPTSSRAPRSASSSHKDVDTVIALPLRLSANGAIERGARAAEAERGGDGERREHVGAVQPAERELVPQGGPGRLPHEIELEPFRRREAALGSRHEKRRVRQGNVADPQPHPRRSAAVTTDRAMSASLRFSFMAVRRRRA